MVEQRQRERARVWLPIRVQWGGTPTTAAGESLAVTYDASDKGVLMLAARAIPVGTRVSLTFDLPEDPPRARTGEGRVVRAGPNEDDPHGLWPFRIAVALDAPLEAFALELEALARSYPVGKGRS